MALPIKKPYESLSKYLERTLPGELESGKSRGKATADIMFEYNKEPDREMFLPFIWGDAGSPASGGGGGDPDADAYLAAVTTAGGTLLAGDETAIQTFFTGLKTAGIYSSIACMYPFMGGVASSNAINAINPGGSFDLTFNGGWTHTAGGALSNGTNGYADSQFNPVTEGYTTFTDFHFSYYNNGASSQIAEAYPGLALDRTTVDKFCATRMMTANSEAAIFGGNGSPFYSVPTTQEGLRLLAGDKSTYWNAWFNNSTIASNRSITQTNFNLNAYIGCLNFNGSAYGFQNYNYVYLSMGNGFTTSEAGDYNTLVNDFQTTLGRNSY